MKGKLKDVFRQNMKGFSFFLCTVLFALIPSSNSCKSVTDLRTHQKPQFWWVSSVIFPQSLSIFHSSLFVYEVNSCRCSMSSHFSVRLKDFQRHGRVFTSVQAILGQICGYLWPTFAPFHWLWMQLRCILSLSEHTLLKTTTCARPA